MTSTSAFKLVRFLRTITKGNKEWSALTYREDGTVIRCYNKDTDEIIQWGTLDKFHYDGMVYEARYVER